VQASVSTAQQSDSVSSAAEVSVTADLSITVEGDSASAAASVLVVGVLSGSQAGDTLFAQGLQLGSFGELISDQEGDGLSATASIPVRSILQQSQISDGIASTAQSLVRGVLLATQADDTTPGAVALDARLHWVLYPSIASSGEIRVGDTSQLVIALDRRGIDQERLDMSDLTFWLALAPAGYMPASGEWQATIPLTFAPYVGSRTQYSIVASLASGGVPGVTTLVSGRQYSVWLRAVSAFSTKRIHVGVFTAK
jgi:hypothetical protein